jgi:hypothetical protein
MTIVKEYRYPTGGWRKKGVKAGALVTFGPWYGRREYGHVIGIDYARGAHNDFWTIEGLFGLDSFHISSIRPVKGRI